jgi:hypothetical protein
MARESVRAMTMNSFERRASTAARIFDANSSRETTSLPSRWPQRLGATWSSMWIAGDAARLVLAHRARDVELVAVAGVGVGDQRHRDRARHDGGVVDHLAHRQEAEVGIAARRRGAGAGHVDGGEAGLLDQARADRVVGAGSDRHAGAGEQVTEGGVHGGRAVARSARAVDLY